MSLSKNEFCSIAFKLHPLHWNLDGDVRETDFEHEKSSCVDWYSPLSSGCHTSPFASPEEEIVRAGEYITFKVLDAAARVNVMFTEYMAQNV